MSDCPACRARLSEMDAAQGVRVELCGGCKGLLLEVEALVALSGGDVEALTASSERAAALGPCLRCNTRCWQARGPVGREPMFYVCGACRLVWLLGGQLEPLRALVLAERRRARAASRAEARAPVPLPGSPRPAAPAALPVELEPFDRVSFERGAANWLAAPIALVLALLFCMTGAGRFFGSLVSMPFHELGHALTSWLSSRFAVPLPFFTVWHDRQSVLFGLTVALVIAAFGVRSWLEARRFGVVLSLVLLCLQLGLSWLVPARLTLMLQILGGALGEIVLGALLLIAFHFPLPDRLRWDFWRWPALVPASLCLANALALWSRAARDVRHMPWGAALGDESDGDMNRLVNGFGWRARELASFYLKVAILSVLALAAAQLWAWYRSRRALPRPAPVTSSGPASDLERPHADPPDPPNE